MEKIDLRLVAEGLSWLRDLGNAPDTRPTTEAGRAWLQRLHVEMQDAGITGREFVDAARDLARAGGFHPTPGAIVVRAQELRLEAARQERETEWRREPAPASARLEDGGHPSEGWTRGRSMVTVHDSIRDLVRRGHGGQALPPHEHYVTAYLREERERTAAEARGERWIPPIYGPSLECSFGPARALSRALPE